MSDTTKTGKPAPKLRHRPGSRRGGAAKRPKRAGATKGATMDAETDTAKAATMTTKGETMTTKATGTDTKEEVARLGEEVIVESINRFEAADFAEGFEFNTPYGKMRIAKAANEPAPMTAAQFAEALDLVVPPGTSGATAVRRRISAYRVAVDLTRQVGRHDSDDAVGLARFLVGE